MWIFKIWFNIFITSRDKECTSKQVNMQIYYFIFWSSEENVMHNHELQWNDIVSIMHACLQTLYLKEMTVWCSCRRVTLKFLSLSWDLSGLISHWTSSLSKLSCCFCTCCFSKRKFSKYEMEMLSACHVLRPLIRILPFVQLWSRSLYWLSR